MMQMPLPIVKELVLIGGGHTHALVLRMWGMKPVPGVRVTVVNPAATAPYSGMLPGHVAGHYSRDDLDIDLVRLARFAGARLIVGHATGINREGKLIHVTGRAPLPYDIASVDIGITSDMPALPGFTDHGIPAKPLGAFASAWAAFRADRSNANPALTVLGGGVAGVELALALAHQLRADGRNPKITLVEKDTTLSALGTRARNVLLRELTSAEITVTENATVARIEADAVVLEDGRRIASDFTLGAAGARPYPWLAETDLTLTDGYINVDETLASMDDPSIYAVGDCAHLTASPRPKAGVFAVRQAPVLDHNLRADLTGGTHRPYRAQRDYLKLISLGGKRALAENRGLTLSGGALWRWKDRIDTNFMQKFRDLEPMPAPALPRNAALGVAEALGPKPMCGGCGAKVGAQALSGALTTLPRAERDDVLSGPGDDAAILDAGAGRRQVISTDHLRAFTLDPALQARIAAVHALGDIWSMGATPQSALATIILPHLSDRLQRQWMDDIMTAAAEVFTAEGADIVGGHSSLGAELTIGFTVTGTTGEDPITNSGARPGDVLILTKPLGTGIVLAAEMALQAPGDAVLSAYASMTRPMGADARILSDATAMTDVTGFGLAGHLLNICQGSGVSARVDLSALPVLDGAEDLAAKGVRSSLDPQNRAALNGVAALPDTPRAALLTDPQTAGGLLAAVPPDLAENCLNALQANGIPAARIGHLSEGLLFIEGVERL